MRQARVRLGCALLGALALAALVPAPAMGADPGTCMNALYGSALEGQAETGHAFAAAQAGADSAANYAATSPTTAAGLLPDPHQCSFLSASRCIAAMDAFLVPLQAPVDAGRAVGLLVFERGTTFAIGAVGNAVSPATMDALMTLASSGLGGVVLLSQDVLVGAGTYYLNPLPDAIGAGVGVGTAVGQAGSNAVVAGIAGAAPFSAWTIERMQGSYPPIVDAGERLDDGDFSYLVLWPYEYAVGQATGPMPPAEALGALTAIGDLPTDIAGPQAALMGYLTGAAGFPLVAVSHLPGLDPGDGGDGGSTTPGDATALLLDVQDGTLATTQAGVTGTLAMPSSAVTLFVALPGCPAL
jgi:hypothetical protein